jgi:hypothetical protein
MISRRLSSPGLCQAMQGGEYRRPNPITWLVCFIPFPTMSPVCCSSSSPSSPPPLGGNAPVRTAKAERRHQERLRMQSPELPAPERALSPAERRALEAEKRALWRAAR